MAENKTKKTDASVDEYIATIENEATRGDCEKIAKLMAKVTKHKPKMWGTSIVGFGSYHYKYDSGREGDNCLVGFSPRKGEISLYLSGAFPERDELLAKLGKYKVAKSCLYIRRLGDVDVKVLEQLVAGSVAEVKRRYG